MTTENNEIKAREAYQNGNISLLTELAEAENPYAQYYLADCYMRGNGVEQDFQTAMYWCGKGARNGHPECMLNMGRMAGGNGNFAEALRWFEKAADLNIPAAFSQLGGMYLYGQGVPQDINKALSFLLKGNTLKDPQASYLLGTMYEQGIGVEKNDKQALAYFLPAAEAGFPPAQFNAGVLYMTGRGTEVDYPEALRWSKAAAAAGFPNAQRNVDWLEARISMLSQM